MPGPCKKCAEPIVDDLFNVCRVCKNALHIKCSGEVEANSRFGCSDCFLIPGNCPRKRTGAPSSNESFHSRASTAMPIACQICQQPIRGPEWTQCRRCHGFYHWSCALVSVKDPGYGCHDCYRVPGNDPRLPRELACCDGDQTLTNADLQGKKVTPVVVRSGAVPKLPPATSSPQRTGPGTEAASAIGSLQWDHMMSMVEEHGEMTRRHGELLQTMISTARSRDGSQASRRRRVEDWVSAASGPHPSNGENLPGEVVAPVEMPPTAPKQRGPIGENLQDAVVTPTRAGLTNTNRTATTRPTPPIEDQDEIVPPYNPRPTARPSATRVDWQSYAPIEHRALEGHADWAAIAGRARSSAEFIMCVEDAQRRRVANNPWRYKTAPALPKFNGDPLDWMDFVSYFLETTNDYEISPVRNVERIRAALGPEQLRVFQCSLVNSRSLPDALNQVRIRWGNPDDILMSLEKDLMDAPAVDMEGHNLWTLMTKARRLVTHARAIGVDDVLRSTSLVRHLESKLPYHMIRSGWTALKLQCRGEATIELLANYLQQEFEMAVDAGRKQVYSKAPGETKRNSGRMVATVQQAASPPDGDPITNTPAQQPASPSERVGTRDCPHCHGDHLLGSCETFKSLGDAARLDLVDKNKLCWKCFGRHTRRMCRSNRACGTNGCMYRHHKLLHSALTAKFAANTASGPSSSPSPPVHTVTHVCPQGRLSMDGVFKVLPIQVHCGSVTIDTFCFIDDGSSVTLVDASLAERLGCRGTPDPLALRWATDHTMTDTGSQRVTIEVSSPGGPRHVLSNVHTLADLDLPAQSLTLRAIRPIFGDNEGPLPYSDGTPKLLLGLPHAHLVAPRSFREDPGSGRVAIQTTLGWVIYGGDNEEHKTPDQGYRACTIRRLDQNLERSIREFYETESFGVRAAPHVLGKDDAKATEILSRTVRRVGDRYEAGLLWAADKPCFQQSITMCAQRTRTLAQKLERDPELARKLHGLMADYHQKLYCSDVSNDQVGRGSWYLPVFPHLNPRKPDKVRLVWDAAALAPNKRSLNSYLLSGPDLLVPLAEVLLRFRERRVAVTADVREMFHQVRIRPEDRDAQRFLFPHPTTGELVEKQLDVASFGATCSPAIALYVQRTNAESWAQDFPEGSREVLTSFYVDDQISSFDDESAAVRIFREVVEVQSRAGMHMCKVRSSHPEVLTTLKDPSSESKTISGPVGSVLGMVWDCSHDVLQFQVNHALRLGESSSLTRRQMLSGTMSLFDPLGLAALVVVKAKILMKECLTMDWDEVVPLSTQHKWTLWVSSLQELNSFPVPRWQGLNPSLPLELHTFVDASEEAFAAVAYVRGVSTSGEVVVSLTMAKTRVAPVKSLTMPRLELQAAVLGARLAQTITDSTSLTISRRVFWTDSADCLCWVRSHKRQYQPFVAARVNEILNTSDELDWRWVPTKENIADIATRFSSPLDFVRWQGGPDFLRLPEEKWPAQTIQLGTPKETVAQLTVASVLPTSLMPAPGRVNEWRKLYNTTAYALRFFLRKTNTLKGPPSPEEVTRAQEELFRAAQQTAYGSAIVQLRADPNRPLSKAHPLYRLCPALDDVGILRVQGRLPENIYPESVRCPVILPADHEVTRLLVAHYHGRFLHANNETVVNEVRRHFAIPGLRRLLKAICSRCQTCRVLKPKIDVPRMGDLPEARAAIGWVAFTYCGLDYFGPYDVVVGRRREKRWGALFTCLTTRAVHMEVAHSLDMDSALLCIRSMCARRNVCPKEIRSDCGTNFIAAAKDLKKAEELFPGTVWKFNPPGAPHMGGAWESMVKLVKRAFNTVVGQRALTDEVLRCSLIEAELIVNKHPLTHVTLDTNDEPALTPADFLYGAGQQRHPNELVMGLGEEAHVLKKSWRTSQQLADHFWKRFSREVVPVLNLRTKWFEKKTPVRVGDPVLIADDTRRGGWRRGVVVETHGKSACDQVRSVRVRTASGELVRPVSKVARLDYTREEVDQV